MGINDTTERSLLDEDSLKPSTSWYLNQSIKPNSAFENLYFTSALALLLDQAKHLLPCNMRRVSSRQRLVSWDAFDAAAASDSDKACESSFASYIDDIDDDSCSSEDDSAQAKPSNLSTEIMGTKIWTRRRKRDRKSPRTHGAERISMCKNVENPKTSPAVSSTCTGVPMIVPSYSWEIGKPALSKVVHFDNLIDDIHLGIFSFLDLSSLRSVMSVNHRYRNLLISGDARSCVWMDHCERILHIKRKTHNGPSLRFVDDLNLPTAAAAAGERNESNLSFLLNLVPACFPTSIDEDTLSPRARLRRTIQQTIPAYRLEEEDQLIRCYQDSSTDRSIIQYIGYVGQGDRCIRSNHPFPRPTRQILKDTSYISDRHNVTAAFAEFLRANQHHDSFRPSLLDILRSSSKSIIRDSSKFASSSEVLEQPLGLTPFVVPFTDESNDGSTTVNITPRFISYFEVNILRLDDSSCNDDMASATRRPRTHRTSYKDCVAVGVGTRSFQFQSRMPGWDQQSYGYHGDDGGIFHASGGMLKQFGPKFGPGDTVGCGIDYVSRGIFYTLNGKFLGYAWENISNEVLQKDLFPVVGIDTNSPIHMNFGSVDSGPFQFDLSDFMKKHEKQISSLYSLDAPCGSETTNDTATKATSRVSTKKTHSGLCSPKRHRRSLIGRRNQREF